MIYNPLKYLFLIFIIPTILSLDNGLAKTPILGWTSHSSYGCAVNQINVKKQAQKMVDIGLAEVGYRYVVVDDCWQTRVDGLLVGDVGKFPKGMEELSDWLHGKDLLFGLQTDINPTTKSNRPGSQGHQQPDSKTFAHTFQIDLLKIDNSQNKSTTKQQYLVMSVFLNQTDRPIYIYADNGGIEQIWTWGKGVANSWRVGGGDVGDWVGLGGRIDGMVGLEKYAGVGGWNDGGYFGNQMSDSQQKSQFILWIMLKSPIIIDFPISQISPFILPTLINPQLISIHQDPLSNQAKRLQKQIYPKGEIQIWLCKLTNNRYAIAFFNKMNQPTKIQISINKQAKINYSSYWIRDPIRKNTEGISTDDVLRVDNVGAHSVELRIVNVNGPHNLMEEYV